MKLQETILCATSPSSSAAGSGIIAIHDIQTGATLASFKQSSAGSHCVAAFESGSLQGGFILASQPDKSIMNVYDFQKVQCIISMPYSNM
jgi:pre-rRNA-processing protein IPI3